MKDDPEASNKRFRALMQLLKERLAEYLTSTKQAPRKDDGTGHAARPHKKSKER
jgi:hypothetical protein